MCIRSASRSPPAGSCTWPRYSGPPCSCSGRPLAHTSRPRRAEHEPYIPHLLGGPLHGGEDRRLLAEAGAELADLGVEELGPGRDTAEPATRSRRWPGASAPAVRPIRASRCSKPREPTSSDRGGRPGHRAVPTDIRRRRRHIWYADRECGPVTSGYAIGVPAADRRCLPWTTIADASTPPGPSRPGSTTTGSAARTISPRTANTARPLPRHPRTSAPPR